MIGEDVTVPADVSVGCVFVIIELFVQYEAVILGVRRDVDGDRSV